MRGGPGIFQRDRQSGAIFEEDLHFPADVDRFCVLRQQAERSWLAVGRDNPEFWHLSRRPDGRLTESQRPMLTIIGDTQYRGTAGVGEL